MFLCLPEELYIVSDFFVSHVHSEREMDGFLRPNVIPKECRLIRGSLLRKRQFLKTRTVKCSPPAPKESVIGGRMSAQSTGRGTLSLRSNWSLCTPIKSDRS